MDELSLDSLAGVRDFSVILSIQTGSEAHQASCWVGTGGGLYLVVKWPPGEADQLTSI